MMLNHYFKVIFSKLHRCLKRDHTKRTYGLHQPVITLCGFTLLVFGIHKRACIIYRKYKSKGGAHGGLKGYLPPLKFWKRTDPHKIPTVKLFGWIFIPFFGKKLQNWGAPGPGPAGNKQNLNILKLYFKFWRQLWRSLWLSKISEK